MSKRSVEKSWELHERAIKVVPMATQTHSKAPRQALREVEPCFLVRGDGCRVWDVDGNEYIDFRNGLGPVSLGYAYPSVNEAVARQLQDGVVFSYSHPLEVEIAERLVDIIPCAERVRFLKTGGEAMAATHRLARGFTGRDHILTCGYHGWVNSMGKGVPTPTKSTYTALPWGNIDAFQTAIDAQGADNIAAISVACDYAGVEQGHQFLPALRTMCDRIGAVLIFDEIVMGFRLRRAGAQEYFGVTPDLAVFAKGISNGVPLSTYLGRADIMDAVEKVVISSTFGGDTLGLAAAGAVLDIYEQEDVIGELWARGEQLHTGFAALAESQGVEANFAGLPPVGMLQLPDGVDRLQFEGACLNRGVITFSVYYPSYSHSEADIDEALGAMGAALQQIMSDPA
ncbi:MAG: aminotransferase class III-fold pyridoxal phosphate-dependent enzyme [Gemmatimonadetes bacterium]|jgi:glutamate-1-semialdehyde aminotransferase|nr:aminotransferase class III-fold pyridoxal phosphate-dependent enzyme [Gemmatimonadota bacterium]MBT5055474.1 aminotransferase class III-fold pyridoxal phosphate-dependent enzyme [Gemmatimonadota bacterium]MBT5143387.1 aminotransferase class III-fold pyridoxal phosphate-dependent enzyme [Gemmatimonadota bacterium]MBT5586679.1 aminotransferase class III-fold pyridoxal phosphate-dependent enzyme [Gemmatimonadota bacterium]MBT5963434.1 aminotransferase class III-fold pyridoxal phosphate-dependen